MHDAMEGNIERYAHDLVRRGFQREEALRRAHAEFGGLDSAKESCRDVIGLSFVDEFRRNVGFAIRMLRKTSSFSLIAIASLAIAIGLNTTAFSLVNSILFRPLPVGHPEKLAFVDTTNPPFLNVPSMSYPDYKDLRDQNDVLSDLIAYRLAPMNMSTGSNSGVRLWGFLASGNYFEALHVSAILGRAFTPSDDRIPGAHPVAVLSYRSWKKRFGGDPAIVNRTVKINGRDFTILGVLPETFIGTEVWIQPEIWVPMMMQAEIERGNPWVDQRGTWNCWVLARLRDGVTRVQAESQLQAIATHVSAANGRQDTLRI